MKRMLMLFNILMIGFSAFSQDLKKYTASFIAEWANDTACIETFTIVGNHLFGRAIHLFPEPHLRQFEFWYDNDGSIKSLDIQFYDLHNTSLPLVSKTGYLPYRLNMNYSNEVIDFRYVNKEGEKQYVHVAPRMDFFGGWIPILGQWEWLSFLAQEDKLQNDLKFVNYVVGVYELDVRKKGDKSIIFESSISAVPITFQLDSEGKIETIDAMGSPWNFIIHKRDPIDIEAFTKIFADKPVLGNPSPFESFTKNILGTKISVEYGRPYKRGREIFGNVVPYDMIWRTGAGSATKITFEKDLDFQGIIIPQGKYNLYTIPRKNSWTLIFNTEENAWGSAHREEFDFEEVTMESLSLPESIEQFTIELAEKNGVGVLQLSWDTTMAQVQFKKRSD